MIALNHIASALMFFGSLYAVVLSFCTYKKMRSQAGGPSLFLLMAASAVYSMGYGLELFSGDPEWTFACLRVQYVGLAFMPYLIARIALDFTGLFPKARAMVRAPLLIGVISFVAMQTNGLHGLFYTTVGTDLSGPFPTSSLAKGPLYALHMGSFIVSCLAALVVYARAVASSRGMDKTRLVVLASTTVFPLLSIALYLFEIVPWHLDPSPVSALICCNLMLFGIYRTGLLELGHLARDLVFSSMREAVIVTSNPEMIADYNEAASRLFPELAREARGRNLSVALPRLIGFLPPENDSADYSADACPDGDTSASTRYEIRNFPVYGTKGQTLGNAYIFRDVTRERQYLESLKKRALVDGLTELYNRAYWEEMSNTAMEACRAAQRSCAVIMVDLDRFKDVNDSFGHDVGDRVLRGASRKILDSLREHYIAGRFGGDEFCLFLPNAGREECAEYSERLRRELQSITRMPGNAVKTVTASIGIALILPGEGLMLSEALSRADKALYRVKRDGRNAIAFYEGERE